MAILLAPISGPLLLLYPVITVDLDGTYGYCSAFLKQAFGGFDNSGPELNERFKFEAKFDSTVIYEIRLYLNGRG